MEVTDVILSEAEGDQGSGLRQKTGWRRNLSEGRLVLMNSIIRDRDVAEVYDQTYRAKS